MKVRDIMAPLVESAHPGDTLRDAAEKMKALDLDPLPVTEGNRVIGCLTNDEVNRRAAQDGLGAGSTRVRDVMSSDVACVRADLDIADALQSIGRDPEARTFSRLPVVDEDGELLGSIAVESLRKRSEQEEASSVTAAHGVESGSRHVDYDEDKVDYMSDESFPASDPLPPPSTLGPEEE